MTEERIDPDSIDPAKLAEYRRDMDFSHRVLMAVSLMAEMQRLPPPGFLFGFTNALVDALESLAVRNESNEVYDIAINMLVQAKIHSKAPAPSVPAGATVQ